MDQKGGERCQRMAQSQGGQAVKTSTETLIAAMRIFSRDIISDDGVTNAFIAEAAQRLEEQQDRIKRLEEELERTKQDRNAIAKKTREPLLLKLDHAAERIAQLEQENDALRADLLLWNEKGVK
jgi:archaellum component FlaC